MIDTQAIRSKILDLAIQGRLSTNNPNEGAPYIPTMDDVIPDGDIPYSIPANWIWVKLGWVMGIERGGSPRPIKEYLTTDENGINWIKIGDVAKNGKYIECTKEKIKPEGEKKSRRVFPGDFLLTNSMSFGRPYISRIEGCIHDGWLVLRNSYSLFFYDFLYYLLSSPYAYAQFSRKASGSTVDNLNIEKVSEAIVPIPPIDEQKRIVDKIESALSIVMSIDAFQAQYADNLTALKSKLIDAAIQGKLTEQLPEDGTAEELYQQIQSEKQCLISEGKIKKEKPLPEISKEEIPFDIPDNWKWVRLLHISYSIFAGKDKPKDFVTLKDKKHPIPVVANAVTNDGIIGYTSIATANAGTLTVAGRGTIGFTCYRDYDYCPIVRLLVIDVADQIYPQYIKYVFQRLTVDSVGSSIPQLTVPMIRPKLIPLPPLAEQKRIVQKLNEILPLCEKNSDMIGG